MQLLKVTNSEVELEADSMVEVPDNFNTNVMIMPRFEKTSIELKIGKNSKASIYVILSEDHKKSEFSLSNFVGDNAIVKTYCFYIGSGSAKILNNLVGQNSSAYDIEVFIQKSNNDLHVYSLLRHSNQNTKGNILVKGIAKEQARVKIDGMIKIDQNGSGAESFLSEHIMLLCPTAHASANPELEIENNDVSSRHAASVAQIDEEKIFYLMSRGINQEDARKLIVEGFLESAVEKIEDNQKRELIWNKIKKYI